MASDLQVKLEEKTAKCKEIRQTFMELKREVSERQHSRKLTNLSMRKKSKNGRSLSMPKVKSYNY